MKESIPIFHFRRRFIIFTLLAALILPALTSSAGLFDSADQKKAKKNAAWFAKNKDAIKVDVTGFQCGSTLYTNFDMGVSRSGVVQFDGTVENHSDKKIYWIVMDFMIVNPQSHDEVALKERMLVECNVYKSETVKFTRLDEQTHLSEIADCAKRIKGFTWKYDVISAIPEDEYEWALEFYKIKTIWKAAPGN